MRSHVQGCRRDGSNVRVDACERAEADKKVYSCCCKMPLCLVEEEGNDRHDGKPSIHKIDFSNSPHHPPINILDLLDSSGRFRLGHLPAQNHEKKSNKKKLESITAAFPAFSDVIIAKVMFAI